MTTGSRRGGAVDPDATLSVRQIKGDALRAALPEVARLRITVFRDWPYLYDGDMEYEAEYLRHYLNSDRSIIVGAFHGDDLVGAATGSPLVDHADDFGAAFDGHDHDLATIFYCAESVLLPAYRGRGIGHRFFDLREAHARKLGFTSCAFCGVIRDKSHPDRPENYRPLDGFWRKRGYAPLPGVVAKFGWTDVGETEETVKPLQFWMKSL